MNFVILVFGIPASGKSYLCNQLLQTNHQIHLLEADDYETKSQFHQDDWKQSRQAFYVDFKNKIQTLQNSIIVVSDDFLLKSQRKMILHECQQVKAAYIEIFMSTSLEDSICQNSKRNRKLNENVIKNAALKLEIEPLLPKFNFKAYKGIEDDIFSKILPESQIYYQKYYLEQDSLRKDQEDQQQQNKTNQMHKLDEQLRKIISKHVGQKNTKVQGKQASYVKSLFLQKKQVQNAEINEIVKNWDENHLEVQFLRVYELVYE